MKNRTGWIHGLLVVGMVFWDSDSFSGPGEQGMNVQGMNVQGMNVQGMNVQGMNVQGMNVQGMNVQGMNVQGMNVQGMNVQGMNVQGMNVQGMNVQGMNVQGMNVQGMNVQGMNVQSLQLLGTDRVRSLAGPMEYRGLAYADVQTAANFQGLQPIPPSPIAYVSVSPVPSVQLQAGPTDTGPGSFIYVPDGSGGAKDLRGTLWNMVLADSTGTGAIGLYISEVAKDTQTNQSKYPSNDDIYLYTVYYRHPATQQWTSLCPVDPYTGKASAMAIPLDPSDWSPESLKKFTFACTATGVGAKCARNWGYKPWKTVTETVWTGAGFSPKAIPLKPFYDACLIAARADYCQDGQSYTKNGTLVDLFDTLDGFTSINPTAGLPYTPGSPGPMMHEEYQISALDFASIDAPPAKPFYAIIPDDELMSLPPEDRAKVAALRRSGMQSSRYDDLDPGRSCLAAPYVDRCDPHEPYACYRDANMSATPYGAFLAVNSPRHCDHDEDTVGAPLDPLCNLCVSRVCSVDPSCCGDPGDTFYPGSLTWDQRCRAIRDQVCRSAPSQPKWPAGKVAPQAGSTPALYLRGAIGAFEGIVTTNGVRYAEGWACDPDFPGASSPIQVSLGGALGAAGAVLSTAFADQPLTATPGWREVVAAECGGAGRHGFRFALPSGFEGDIYVYGIDLNTPGAPFSLLRGGRKTTAGGPAMPKPLAAIWTGWVEPSLSGQHSFSVDVGPDKYRLWVNGAYVAGNWVDADATVPGAFTTPPPPTTPPPSLYLQKGVRYAVRVEYLRPSTTTTGSKLTLRWTPPGASAPADIPTGALYPAAPGAGNGLLATYWNAAGVQNATQSYGAVNFVWPSCDGADPTCVRPAPGIRVEDAFTARFEGQVMPPVSGDYLFTADTDGAAKIWVNGTLVTDASRPPPAAGKPEVCGERDICRPGAAISRTCDQGYFCAAQICLKDPSCCSITWDAACVQQVATICHLECRRTAPLSISLRAGTKYDIKVEFAHAGGAGSRGARLKLHWALSGGARDSIPIERLFAAPSGSAPGKGVGLNAAYFSDDKLKAEFFGRVEPSLNFADATPPTATRTSSIACGFAGGPACGTGDLLGPPALVAPAPQARVVGPTVTLQVTGATPGATITVAKLTTASSGQTTSTPLTTFVYARPANGGPMTSPAISLAFGPHKLTVAQALAGNASAASAPLELTVVPATDPSLPPPPGITLPAGGLVATNGKITVTGTAAPGAKVNVTIAGGATTIVTAHATTGAWTATINLPAPGAYTLSFTQTVGGKTTATGTPIAAQYTLPPITVTTPPATETAFSGSVNVTGTATAIANSKIIVTDGDGRYFTEVQSLDIHTSGAFPLPPPAAAKPLTLDAGRHVLRIFQRVNNPDGTVNLDGEPVERTVTITPALGALRIDTPAENAIVASDVLVKGSGAPVRTGLRYGVAIFQGTTKRGEATVDDQGNFELPLQLTGAGQQQLTASLIVRSLSGGGAAESAPGATRNVVVRPAAPKLTKPMSPHAQSSTTLAVAGTGAPTAQVSLFLDGAPLTLSTPLVVAANGTFSRSVVIAKGSHVLAAKQTLAGATSEASVAVSVSIGDVTPPALVVAQREISIATDNETGTTFDYRAQAGITATDNGAAVPVTCVPASPSFFRLGNTTVTCSAKDAGGNVASTTLTVTVTSSAAPIVATSNIVVEATGADGAAVAYQVAATGFLASCAPPGATTVVPCSSWRRVSDGLGRLTALAMDPQDGTLYASTAGELPWNLQAGETQLLKSTDRGATWTTLAMPGVASLFARITVAPTTPPTLYVPSKRGLLASRNGGQSWTTALAGDRLIVTSVDPNDPHHVFVWNEVRSPNLPPLLLFETTDGGQTWTNAAEGLPQDGPEVSFPSVAAVAFDRLHPGRIYAVAAPERRTDITQPELIYRRVGSGRWERLKVPPLESYRLGRPRFPGVGVAPKLTPCSPGETCPTFPTVFVGSLMSTDGGETWTPPPGLHEGGVELIFFDQATDGVVYSNTDISRDYGRTWSPWNTNRSLRLEALHQDPQTPNTMFGRISGGIAKTTNGGATWLQVATPVAGMNHIFDVVPDPVDPKVAYLASDQGLYKAKDASGRWEVRSLPGLGSQIAIDPFNGRNIYVASESDYPAFVSTDAGGDNGAPWTQTSFKGLAALDPGNAGVVFSIPHIQSTPLPAATIVHRFDQVQNRSFALNTAPLLPISIQALPDPARTIALSYKRSDTTGGTLLFSARDAQPTPATTQVTAVPLLAPAKLVFDNSAGRNDIFVSGEGLGSTPDRLYKASLANLTFAQVGGGQAGIDFRRLSIDAGSNGQDMYTAGRDDGLWESHDGGTTWSKDGSAPGYVDHVWPSPLDGSLYVTIAPYRVQDWQLQDLWWWPTLTGSQSLLWKRTRGAIQPGATIVEGDLRVACVSPNSTRSAASGAIFPIGTTTVACTAIDVFGHASTGTFTITVKDSTPPVVTVPASAAGSTASTDPNATVAVTFTSSATDTVGGSLPTTCTPASGSGFRVGVTTVTCTAVDAKNNTGRASFPVVVTRTGQPLSPPTLTVPPSVTLEATAATGATADLRAMVTATRSTGAALTPTCTPALTQTTFFAAPTTNVSCSASDGGLTVTRAFIVKVVDTKPPAMTVPSPGPTVPAQGAWGATVSYTATWSDIVDGGPFPAACVPAPGSVFAAGTTAVTCRATDKAGNMAKRQFNVVVQDVSPPVLTVPPLLLVEATDFLGARVSYDVSANDAQDGVLPVDCVPPSGSVFALGDTPVSCETVDTSGNTVRASFVVRVVDLDGPTISVPATIRLEATQAGGAPATFSVSAFDAVSLSAGVVCTRSLGGTPVTVVSGDILPFGDTLVTCVATDAALNSASASFHVIVDDTIGPVLTVPSTRTVQTTANGTAVVSFTVSATNRGAPVPVVCTPPTGSRFLFGTTAVNCVARDAAGNETRRSFNVVVRDAVAPVISAAANITAYATTTAGATVTYTTPTANDAFDGARPVSCTPASGSAFAPAATTVTCTASDNSGNTRTRIFTVTILFDTRQPNGSTFTGGFAADGSSLYARNAPINVAFALTGVSAPITNLAASAFVAPVTAGVPGTFVAATPVSGSGSLFVYDAPSGTYRFAMSTAALTPGVYRFRADVGDGAPREVNFTISGTSITITPSSFGFGSVVIPQQWNAAPFVIRNIGATANTLTVGVDGQSIGTADFPIVSNTCVGSVPAGGTCSVEVGFRANNPPGPKHGMFTATASDGSSLSAPMNGLAWRPAQLVLEPGSGTTNFGSVPLLTESGVLLATVRNLGEQPSGPMSFLLPSPDFTIANNTCPPSLSGLQTCSLTIRFRPTALGSRSGTLTVGASPGGNPPGLVFSGVGLQPLTAAPTSLTFPGILVGRPGDSQVITVRNMSTAPSGALTTTVSPSQFRVTANTCGSLAGAGATCSVTIQWFPTTAGTIGGSFSITGAGGWAASATLSGTGIPEPR